MLRKINNSLAIIALSFIITNSTVFALPAVPAETTKTKTVRIDADNNYSYFNEVIVSGRKDSYTIDVAPNARVKVILRAEKPVSLKITAPDGSNQSYSEERFYTLEFSGKGEHTIQLEARTVSVYSLEVITQ